MQAERMKEIFDTITIGGKSDTDELNSLDIDPEYLAEYVNTNLPNGSVTNGRGFEFYRLLLWIFSKNTDIGFMQTVWENLKGGAKDRLIGTFKTEFLDEKRALEYLEVSEQPSLSYFDQSKLSDNTIIKFFTKYMGAITRIDKARWNKKIEDAAIKRTQDSIFWIPTTTKEEIFDYFDNKSPGRDYVFSLLNQMFQMGWLEDIDLRKGIIERFGFLYNFKNIIEKLRPLGFPTKEEIILSYKVIQTKPERVLGLVAEHNWKFIGLDLRTDKDVLNAVKSYDLYDYLLNAPSVELSQSDLEHYAKNILPLKDKNDSRQIFEFIARTPPLDHLVTIENAELLGVADMLEYWIKNKKVKTLDLNDQSFIERFLNNEKNRIDNLKEFIKSPGRRIISYQNIFKVWQILTITEFNALINRGIISSNDIDFRFYYYGLITLTILRRDRKSPIKDKLPNFKSNFKKYAIEEMDKIIENIPESDISLSILDNLENVSNIFIF